MVEQTESADSKEHGWTADDGIVNLNHAAQSPLSPDVQKAGMDAIRRPHWRMNEEDDQKRVRTIFASLIDAEDPSDIAITPSTAFAISLAARNIQRTVIHQQQPKGQILVVQDQFNSAVYPWQQICEESKGNVSLAIVPHPAADCSGWTEAILNRIDDSIIVACLPPLHWSDGELIDLEKISEACKKHDVSLIVDATQVVGIMPFSVRKIEPDLLACSVHKWLRSPAGTALVYVSKKVQSTWIPLDLHGRSRDMGGGKEWDASKDEMGPRGYPEKFVADARKFDSGGKPNPILLPMLRAALEEVVLLDLENAQTTLKVLMDPLFTWAHGQGYSLPREPRAYHLVGIRPKQRTPEELLEVAKQLKDRRVIIAVRCGGFRISPYLETHPSDIQRLISGFESVGSI